MRPVYTARPGGASVELAIRLTIFGGCGAEGDMGRLDEVVLDREARGRVARGHVQLAVDRGQVVVDRARADHEPLGDLGIGEPLSEETQHLNLALGQAGRVSRREGSR